MTKPASAPPADKWIALEANLKARYDVCEDFAATPSSILLAVLNAVAAVNDDTTAQLADIAASAQVREVEANCRGSWQLGNNCKRCPRCLSTMPAAEPVPVAQGIADRLSWLLRDAEVSALGNDATYIDVSLEGFRDTVTQAIATIERLRGAFDDADETASVHWYGEWVEAKRRADATEASLAACRADAERLDYLIATGKRISRTDGGRYRVMGLDGISEWQTESDTGRVAIDAARAVLPLAGEVGK